MQPSFLIENNFDTHLVCGIDEAGRGPLAGPVVACCIILDRSQNFTGINDSKKLTKKIRQQFFADLINHHQYGIGVVSNQVIDQINILEATKLAMFQAYQNLHQKYQVFPEVILVDGNFQPFKATDKIIEIKPIVKGDQQSLSIACASIIAKEYRDKLMEDYHQQFPEYGFNRHSGYGTKIHIDAIKKYGIKSIHRQTFEPIKSILKNNFLSYENN